MFCCDLEQVSTRTVVHNQECSSVPVVAKGLQVDQARMLDRLQDLNLPLQSNLDPFGICAASWSMLHHFDCDQSSRPSLDASHIHALLAIVNAILSVFVNQPHR